MLTEERFAENSENARRGKIGHSAGTYGETGNFRIDDPKRPDSTCGKGITGESSWWGDGFGDGLYNQRCRNHIADDTECR